MGHLKQLPKSFGYYVSYHLMSPGRDCPPCQTRLRRSFRRRSAIGAGTPEIIGHAIVTSWDSLFEVNTDQYYTLRGLPGGCWRWHDEILKEKEPHRPSARARSSRTIMMCIANRTEHPDWSEIDTLCRKLPAVLRMHDKTDPRHRFELSELEAVALELMAEARRMRIDSDPRHPYPGRKQAIFAQPPKM